MLFHWNIVLIEIDTFDGWHVMAWHTAPQHRWPNQFRAVFATLSSPWFIIYYLFYLQNTRWSVTNNLLFSPAPHVGARYAVNKKVSSLHFVPLITICYFNSFYCEQSELIRARGVSVCDASVSECWKRFIFLFKWQSFARRISATRFGFLFYENSIVELRHRDYLALTSVVLLLLPLLYEQNSLDILHESCHDRKSNWNAINLVDNEINLQRADVRHHGIHANERTERQDGRMNEQQYNISSKCICATSWMYRPLRDRLFHMPATDVKQIIWHENRNWLLLSRRWRVPAHRLSAVHSIIY